ncbi:hypothetical protein [Phenylobacterium sp.]|uniref:hypothetical protein n=1 Tax=Phenylobacterium sp. TaxID=1871053 RepID=UPI0037852373
MPQSASHCWRFSAPRRRRKTQAQTQKEYRSRIALGLTGAHVYLSPDVLLALRLAGREGPLATEAAQVLEEWAAHWLHASSYR